MNSVEKIEKTLKEIDGGMRNNTDQIFLNVIRNEFITLRDIIRVPRIGVEELGYDEAAGIMDNLVGFIPEFLRGHHLLEKRKPRSEQHTLQFVRQLPGRCVDFIHMFKVDMKFGGDSSNVVEQGDPFFYPSYQTDRLYYKSRLIPSRFDESLLKIDFEPLRLIDRKYVEAEKDLFTFALFDDANAQDLTRELHARLGLDIFHVSPGLYPFIVYDYFTSCFNVPYPREDELEEALEIFEPLFLIIYSRYKSLDDLTGGSESPEKKWQGTLKRDARGLFPTEAFLARSSDYFRRFSIARDDELALKGWWRIDIKE